MKRFLDIIKVRVCSIQIVICNSGQHGIGRAVLYCLFKASCFNQIQDANDYQHQEKNLSPGKRFYSRKQSGLNHFGDLLVFFEYIWNRRICRGLGKPYQATVCVPRGDETESRFPVPVNNWSIEHDGNCEISIRQWKRRSILREGEFSPAVCGHFFFWSELRNRNGASFLPQGLWISQHLSPSGKLGAIVGAPYLDVINRKCTFI